VPAVTSRNRDGSLLEQTAATTAVAAPGAIRPTAGTVIGGAALATGGAGLSVEGHPVRLFGLRAPGPRDRCAAADGSVHPCDAMAQAALAAHLAGNATVNCHMPQGQRGDPGYVCRDAAGVDLAGLLVAGGFAHADTKSSFDYVSAETAARASRLGLWRVR
jgi:endonuclease YncB( thermonuclease family)